MRDPESDERILLLTETTTFASRAGGQDLGDGSTSEQRARGKESSEFEHCELFP